MVILLKEVEPKTLYEGIIDNLNGGVAMNPSIALKNFKTTCNPIDLDNKRKKKSLNYLQEKSMF